MLPCLVVAGAGRSSSDQTDIEMLSCLTWCGAVWYGRYANVGAHAGSWVEWLKGPRKTSGLSAGNGDVEIQSRVSDETCEGLQDL